MAEPASLFDQPWPVRRFDSLDSTNEEARRLAAGGDRGPVWLVAVRQTAGRGRQGRVWDSPTGNLFATAYFPFGYPLAQAGLVSFSAGLALLDAVRMLGAETSALRLKWPNDILAGAAKLSGILVETVSQPGGGMNLAVGIGVNVETAPEVPGRETCRVRDLPGCASATAADVLSRLDIGLRSRLRRLTTEGFASTRADWLAVSAHIGQRVETRTNTGVLSGVMRGLGEDGALVLETDDGEVLVRAGDVSLVG
jgi:BirA family biotin operon repressor/biotin-[acetyl-CoA-carboxylase] ligase